MTCKKIVKIIFMDIDNTLVKSYFIDYYLARPDLLMEKLATAKPFPWIVNSTIFDDDAIVHFITGRFDHQEEVTRNWIECNIGITEFGLHVVGYTNYEDYVMDKARAFREVLLEVIEEFGNGIELHFYEDSEKVIEVSIGEKNKVCDIPMEIHLVKGGELQAGYMA